MTTLTVLIDTESKRKYKLNKERIGFEELKEQILRSEGLNALEMTTEIAAKHGLHKMTLKEIETEITGARNAKGRS